MKRLYLSKGSFGKFYILLQTGRKNRIVIEGAEQCVGETKIAGGGHLCRWRRDPKCWLSVGRI